MLTNIINLRNLLIPLNKPTQSAARRRLPMLKKESVRHGVANPVLELGDEGSGKDTRNGNTHGKNTENDADY
jgi:hypothetical protein